MLDDNADNAGLKRLASAFTSLVRSRGTEYFEAGRVSLVERSADLLAAEVSGSGDRYRTAFVRRGTEVRFGCTCPNQPAICPMAMPHC